MAGGFAEVAETDVRRAVSTCQKRFPSTQFVMIARARPAEHEALDLRIRRTIADLHVDLSRVTVSVVAMCSARAPARAEGIRAFENRPVRILNVTPRSTRTRWR